MSVFIFELSILEKKISCYFFGLFYNVIIFSLFSYPFQNEKKKKERKKTDMKTSGLRMIFSLIFLNFDFVVVVVVVVVAVVFFLLADFSFISVSFN